MKSEAYWRMGGMFPELTELQFKVLTLYVIYPDSDCIADLLKCSPVAVKKNLQRIRKNLHLDKLESVRLLYLCRIMASLVNMGNTSPKQLLQSENNILLTTEEYETLTKQ